jgi:hypothetical protein
VLLLGVRGRVGMRMRLRLRVRVRVGVKGEECEGKKRIRGGGGREEKRI